MTGDWFTDEPDGVTEQQTEVAEQLVLVEQAVPKLKQRRPHRKKPEPAALVTGTSSPENPLAHDPAAWIDANILVSELGKPFKLAPYQRRVLAEMFRFDDTGKLWIDEGIWSEPKKGGKTTLAAAIGLWWGDTQEAPNEILVCANDLEQATSRAFATMKQMVKRNPGLGAKVAKVSTTTITFKTGTVIKAIASEYAGAAGSNHGLVL